ncbi:Ribosomal protein 60S [Cynara cardunculus var. scolymus]|uniref:Ribosomal protein 60S n=1 Tax=Cynara cardunculus var. scolymus TaxID=59895 RepID=A0A103Y680_CYNCS|nr:Ribosomal protein 60S [Cynara cardunculus var. scolymus]
MVLERLVLVYDRLYNLSVPKHRSEPIISSSIERDVTMLDLLCLPIQIRDFPAAKFYALNSYAFADVRLLSFNFPSKLSSSFNLPSQLFKPVGRWLGTVGGVGVVIGGGVAAASTPSGGAAATEARAVKEKKEEKEESDDDMGFSLFD